MRRRVASLVVVAVLVFVAAVVVQLAALPLVPVTASAATTPLTAYVTNFTSNSVTPIDLTTDTPGNPIPVGHNPVGIAITPDGTTAYVANQFSDTVTPIDLTTNTPGSPIPVGTAPSEVAVTPDGKTAYVTNQNSNTVTPIMVATNTPGSPIPVGGFPFGIAITPDGTTAYVANGGTSNTVTPITVATNTPGSPILVSSGPFGIAITPDGTTAYVADVNSNTVTPISVATNAPGSSIPVGVQPAGVAFTPDGKTAYVANRQSHTVTPISVATNTPGSPIPVGVDPLGIAITPDGTTTYVTNGGGTNTVTPISVATNTPGSPIPVGSSPFGIAITPVRHATTMTQLTVNPPSPATANTTETLTAAVTPTAAGKVQFRDGNTPIGTPVTVSDGAASITTTLPSGTHPLTAVFTPNNPTAYSGSTAPTVTYMVNAAITTTTLGVTPASPVDKNTAETLTATVTPTAAGSVQFTDGTTPLGTAATDSNGTAAITTTLGSGTHSLTAVFTPTDAATFGSSTSNTVSFMVNAPTGAKATTTTLRAFPNRAFEGFPVIFLANVAPRGATGTVQLMDGTTPLGGPVPVFGGFGLTITTLPTGTHSLSAVFTPTDPAAFAPSASAPVPLTVNPLLSRVPLR